MRRSAAGLQHGTHGLEGSHTEVGDFYIVLVVQEQILRFQVTVAARKREREKSNKSLFFYAYQ